MKIVLSWNLNDQIVVVEDMTWLKFELKRCFSAVGSKFFSLGGCVVGAGIGLSGLAGLTGCQTMRADVGTQQVDEANDSVWQLVWADEFDVDGRPNPEHWDYERGFVRNREAQWYQPENAWVEGGQLIIEARRSDEPNPTYRANARRGDWRRSRETLGYTSACLITRGKQDWLYGRFEVKAKIDVRAGMWPAIWFLGFDPDENQMKQPWPINGEIDLMEYYTGGILANACWSKPPAEGDDSPQWASHRQAWDAIKVPLEEIVERCGDESVEAWVNRFHVWRMDWDEQSIDLYVDDVLLNSIDLDQTIHWHTDGQSPFRKPMYLLINLAVGGTNGGDPSKADYPARYLIDYVRVYQRQWCQWRH